MKFILTIFISLGLVTFVKSQDSINTETSFICKNFYSDNANYLESSKIDLKLSTSKRRDYSYDNSRPGFFALFIGGLAFTTASILEGDKNFRNWDPINQKWTAPNFWKQTPRQLMFCVGLGMTLTGGVLTLSYK